MSRIAGTVPSSLLIQDGESVRLSPIDGYTWQSHKYATTKADVGLSNVDNTSDLNKPVSNATQIEINDTLQDAKDYTDTKVSGLATVAHTGSYDDLSDKPTITAQVNSDWTATSGKAQILNKPTLGTAASENSSAFATASQGAKADSAVQPSDLADVATSGDYADLLNKPTIPNGSDFVKTTTDQDVAGLKTFTYGSIELKTPFANSFATASYDGAKFLDESATPHEWELRTKAVLTDDRVHEFPDKSGTVAHTDDVALAMMTATEFTTDEINTLKGTMSTVAFSGSYTDLSNKPTIPTVPEQFMYVNGTKHLNPIEFVATGTVSGGNVVFDITSGGNAVFSQVFTDSISLEFTDSAGVYAHGTPVVSGDRKTLTIPITKQVFAGVVVLSITVLGSVNMNAAPNGTIVKVRILGV